MKDNAVKSPRLTFALRPPFFASIRGKLFLLLVSVLIPVMLVQGAFIYSRFKERVENQSRANLEVSRAVADTFSSFVKDVLHQELAIGASLTLHEVPSPEEMNRILELNKEEFSAVHSFMWLDPHGRVIASSLASSVGLDLSDRDYADKLITGKQWEVSSLILSRATGKPVFTVGRAILGKKGARSSPSRCQRWPRG